MQKVNLWFPMTPHKSEVRLKNSSRKPDSWLGKEACETVTVG